MLRVYNENCGHLNHQRKKNFLLFSPINLNLKKEKSFQKDFLMETREGHLFLLLFYKSFSFDFRIDAKLRYSKNILYF